MYCIQCTYVGVSENLTKRIAFKWTLFVLSEMNCLWSKSTSPVLLNELNELFRNTQCNLCLPSLQCSWVYFFYFFFYFCGCKVFIRLIVRRSIWIMYDVLFRFGDRIDNPLSNIIRLFDYSRRPNIRIRIKWNLNIISTIRVADTFELEIRAAHEYLRTVINYLSNMIWIVKFNIPTTLILIVLYLQRNILAMRMRFLEH